MPRHDRMRGRPGSLTRAAHGPHAVQVALRNVRRDAMKAIEKLEKDGAIGGAAAAVLRC